MAGLTAMIVVFAAFSLVYLQYKERQTRNELDRRFVSSLVHCAESEATPTSIAVAVFDMDRAPNGASESLAQVLDSNEALSWQLVGSAEIQEGILDAFDVVIFPGESGKKKSLALGETGKEAVKKFVRQGGGYVGICGGAFLATAGYDWSLGIINARTITGDVEMPGGQMVSVAARGSGSVKIELTDWGKQVLRKPLGLFEIRYSGGPIFLPAGRSDLPEYVTLAVFRDEIWAYEMQRGTMVNTPAIIAARFGKGNVIASSPHPEASLGLEPIVIRLIRAVSRKDAGSGER